MPTPPVRRAHPLLRRPAGILGIGVLVALLAACVLTLPWTLGPSEDGVARYRSGITALSRLPPSWVEPSPAQAARLHAGVPDAVRARISTELAISDEELRTTRSGPGYAAMRECWPRFVLGSDALGRSVLVRVLVGGGISLTIGLAAAMLSVLIGTLYGAIAGYIGGRVDGVMMRVVDVLYGLPYVLLVVLLAVASDAMVGEFISRQRERGSWVREQAHGTMIAAGSEGADVSGWLSAHAPAREAWEREALVKFPPREISRGARTALDLGTLLIAIGGVSWLTMARVIRGQVLSLKAQPFMEAARAIGVSPVRAFVRHLMPNLVGPIVVYATLTVPQAILQESFLSFLGIGVKPPLPSWGNMAAEGLGELNPYQSNWWLLLFPCLMLGVTLLALNFVGEGLREALDPKRRGK
jgi:oligopeptide transport system permease protein